MKYYLLSIIDRIKQHTKQLDAESILYNKKWVVFNDAGNKQVFIFRPNKELIISHNGEVIKSKWELLPDGSMILDVKEQSFLLNPSFVDGQFLALNLDGHEDSLMMIEHALYETSHLHTLKNVNSYLEEKYVLKPKREEEKRILAEKKRIELEEKRKFEEEEKKRQHELFIYQNRSIFSADSLKVLAVVIPFFCMVLLCVILPFFCGSKVELGALFVFVILITGIPLSSLVIKNEFMKWRNKLEEKEEDKMKPQRIYFIIYGAMALLLIIIFLNLDRTRLIFF